MEITVLAMAVAAVLGNIVLGFLLWQQQRAIEVAVEKAKKIIWEQRDGLRQEIAGLPTLAHLEEIKELVRKNLAQLDQETREYVRQYVELVIGLERKKVEALIQAMDLQVEEVIKDVPKVSRSGRRFVKWWGILVRRVLYPDLGGGAGESLAVPEGS